MEKQMKTRFQYYCEPINYQTGKYLFWINSPTSNITGPAVFEINKNFTSYIAVSAVFE